jgi:hypothetical protein
VLEYAEASRADARALAWTAILHAGDAAGKADERGISSPAGMLQDVPPGAAVGVAVVPAAQTATTPGASTAVPQLKEAATTAFILDVTRAAAAFCDAATRGWATSAAGGALPPAHPQSLPAEAPEWRRSRSREPVWSALETSRFGTALQKHNKNFFMMSRDLQPRSPQQCAAFYYSDWRRSPLYLEPKSRPDIKEFNMDRQLTRREHAWFHFWRFDEAACGPSLPPSAVHIPPALRFSASCLAPPQMADAFAQEKLLIGGKVLSAEEVGTMSS